MASTRRLPLFVALVAALAAAVSPLEAWTEAAHRAVAVVAQERASDKAVRSMGYLMGREFAMADAAGFADAALNERPETVAWREITLPPGAKKVELKRDCPIDDCVTAKVRELEGILRLGVKEKPERQEAMRFLVGLAAELHQPLNADYPPDRGGDRTVILNGRETPLYQVWDEALLADADAEALAARVRELITEERAETWSSGTLRDWTWDTHQVALQIAYAGIGVDTPQAIDEAYLEAAREAAELQLAKAAVRLAALLDRIWP